MLTHRKECSTLASIIVEWISKTWKYVPVNIIHKLFLKRCLYMPKMEPRAIFFGMTVNTVGRAH
jgi:hypothetical protein